MNDRLRLALNFSLTILEAATGYGKSTAILAFLQNEIFPTYWFTISGADRDPKLFLAKLFTAFNQRNEYLGNEPLRILEMEDSTPQEAMIALVNAISTQIHEDTLFILDDFHRVSDIPEIMSMMNWMIENIPPQLHIIIATRHSLAFPSLNKWRVKGNYLEISKEDLAFTDEEIKRLFEEQYEISLSDKAVDHLLTKTEGWAIVLQMVWQTLQRNPEISIQQVLEENRQSKLSLFEYLADEVLSGLDPEIQEFLIKTSILSKMDSLTCDFLLTVDNSDKTLKYLHNSGLFIEELRPGVYRYHKIFREFLLNRLQREGKTKRELHLKIASYFRAHEYWEEAMSHLLSAGDFQQINQILESIGEKMIREGRHETIGYWINEIPQAVQREYPYINYLSGEVNRYQ
ncbi:MAG: hypothetical protein P8Y37_13930, partial [Anaerolineales bacterium]